MSKKQHDGIYLRGSTLWLRVKNGDGKWCGVSSGIVVPEGTSTAERNRQMDAAARVREKLMTGASPEAPAAAPFALGRTKTGVPRLVPVHPTLAVILEAWKREGWPGMMGREPKSEDLLVPLPASGQSVAGRMRRPQASLWQLHRDLQALGIEEHCFHDLRHTFISLLRSDGATKDILTRITHSPSREVLDG